MSILEELLSNNNMVAEPKKSEFKLGEDQLKAIELFKEFLENTKLGFSLTGYSGSGKSSTLKYFLDIVREKGLNYSIAATTNKAALVLSKIVQDKATTIHSLLSMRPGMDIEAFDLSKLVMFSSNMNTIPTEGIVFCDEASMLSRPMLMDILQRCKEKRTKVVFIGDIAQLSPVEEDQESPVFTIPGATLSQIFRQQSNNPILDILTGLRDKPLEKFPEVNSDNGSIFILKSKGDIIGKSLPMFNNMTVEKDTDITKIMAYTNKRVDWYNDLIKKKLFSNNQEFNVNELLMFCENLEDKITKEKFYNGLDYMITDVSKKMVSTDIKGLTIIYYYITVRSTDNVFRKSFKVISKETSEATLSEYGNKIEKARTTALKHAKGSKPSKDAWREYFMLTNMFITTVDICLPDGRVAKKRTFTNGYAVSIHKAQGSSYDAVFVDLEDVNSCRDINERRRLQYVACSRTRKDIYIYQ